MVIKTELCDLLGIQYPIIQGAMAWVGTAELASAVSNAGGLGIISSVTERGLENEIKIARDITKKPFGVNIPILSPNAKRVADRVIDEGIEIVTTSVGDPMKFTKRLKEGGVRVIQVVTKLAHARRANKAGVDAIVAQGVEAGGHPGPDEIATLVLVPQVVDSVSIPVIAAGGIGDARGFAAALMLGAAGVQIGTRFVAAKECIAHEKFKKAILDARDTDTTMIGRGIFPSRVIKNEFASKFGDKAGFDIGNARAALINGDLVNGAMWCGQVAGLIREVMSVDDIIKGIVIGAGDIIKCSSI